VPEIGAAGPEVAAQWRRSMLDEQTAYNLVAEYLTKQFEVPADQITPEARVFADLGLDSIDALDMLALLDKQYGVAFNEVEVRQIRTVQDVARYIVRNLPPEAAAP
jgi:acyl carrier protein